MQLEDFYNYLMFQTDAVVLRPSVESLFTKGLSPLARPGPSSSQLIYRCSLAQELKSLKLNAFVGNGGFSLLKAPADR